MRSTWVISICLAALGTIECRAQVPEPILITEGEGGFTGTLEPGGRFGISVADAGDIDRNGVSDLIVGAYPEGCCAQGELHVLLMEQDGTVSSTTIIDYTRELFPDRLVGDKFFGLSVSGYRDVDGDGIPEVLVNSLFATWMLFLEPDGKLRESKLLFQSEIEEWFGLTVASIDDGGNDRMPDIAISHYHSASRGRLVLLYMDGPNVERSVPIENSRATGLPFGTNPYSYFGERIVDLGDTNGDGFTDLAVAVNRFYHDTSTSWEWGAIWIFFLQPWLSDGGLESDPISEVLFGKQLIDSRELPGFVPEVGTDNCFGCGMLGLGDLDANGYVDLGFVTSGSGTTIFFLGPNGTIDWRSTMGVRIQRFFDYAAPGAQGNPELISDLNGDGAPELIITDYDYNEGRGAIRIHYDLGEVSPQIVPAVDPAIDVGEPVIIAASIRATVEIQEATVSSRPAGTPTFFTTAMTKLGFSDFRAEIPAFFLGDGGFEYMISTDDPTGKHPRDGFLSIPTRHPDGLPIPTHDKSAASYQLVSMPLELDSTSALFSFEDELGPYDITEWRFFELERGNWREQGISDIQIEPGRAYALSRRDGGRIVNSDAGQTVRTDQSFMIDLRNGWHLVGNPFAFDVPLGNVSLASGAAVELWAYDSTWSVESDAMEVFGGYAIKMDARDTLWVDPDLSQENVDRQPARAGHDPESTVNRPQPSRERQAELEAMMSKLGANTRRSTTPDAGRRTPDVRLQAYPNPFTSELTVTFELDGPTHVALEVYDLLGRRVATLVDAQQSAGLRSLKWTALKDGLKLADGLYVLKLQVGDNVQTKTISLTQ